MPCYSSSEYGNCQRKITDGPQKLTECLPELDRKGSVQYTEIKQEGGSGVEVEVRVEPGREKLKVVILTGEGDGEAQQLARWLSGVDLSPVPVRRGEARTLLPQGEFLRFYTDGKGVSGQTQNGCFSVPLRLYELEERLDKRRFVRISNSEIVNLDHVTALDLSLAGTIRMTLDRSVNTYVSRRYVKRIKEALGLRKERQP